MKAVDMLLDILRMSDMFEILFFCSFLQQSYCECEVCEVIRFLSCIHCEVFFFKNFCRPSMSCFYDTRVHSVLLDF